MAGRILYQLVAPMHATIGPAEPARRAAFLNAHAGAGVTVEVRSAQRARASIEGAWDAVEVGPSLVAGLRAAEAEGFGAGIVGCFSDPALDAVREAVSMPAVGPGGASVRLALELSDRFSILAPGDGPAGRSRAFLRGIGAEGRLASVRGVGLSVVDMARAAGDGTLDAAIATVAARARRCVEEDGAEAIILGCMSMAFLDPTPAIEAEVGVPVINPVLAALRTAETLMTLKLSHSRRRWPAAEARPIVELDLGDDPRSRQMEATR